MVSLNDFTICDISGHKSPNIKWQKIAFYLKMKKCGFFSSKQHYLGKTLKFFLHYSARLVFVAFLKAIASGSRRSPNLG